MSVTGTPIDPPVISSISCADQSTIIPDTTTIYGELLPTKMRGVAVKQSQTATLQLTLLNRDGDPVDLGSCGSATVKYKFREAVMSCATSASTPEVDAGIVDPSAGVVSADIPVETAVDYGIYIVEVGVFDTDNLLFSNSMYLFVEPSLFGTTAKANLIYPMPSIQEMRIRLRDNAPEENRLIDEYEFDIAELCDALIRCVRYWNYSQPPINIFFNSTNFPFYLPNGYSAPLLEIAARRYMRNHLPYQAGGISVDDQNKFQQYLNVSQALWQDYTQFIKTKKVQINCEGAMQSWPSSYSSYYQY